MKITRYEDKEEWKEARFGKITGSRLGDLIVKRGNGKKLEWYRILAEKVAIPDDGCDKMQRGIDLEPVAIALLEEKLGKKFDDGLVIWSREDNDDIAVSPDGYTEDLTEAAEAKCLGSAYHLKAYLEQKIPNEYEAQYLQYFIVNDKLEKLHFIFHDDRMPEKISFFYLTVTRAEVQEQVDQYLEFERQTLAEMDDLVIKLSGF